MSIFDRERTISLLDTYVTSPHIIPHSYYVEAVMRSLAKKFSPENEEMWGIAGLVHDLDYDLVDWKRNMSLHGYTTIELLKKENLGNEELYHAILAHNAETGAAILSPLDRAIFAADPITGFIAAVARYILTKKLKA